MHKRFSAMHQLVQKLRLAGRRARWRAFALTGVLRPEQLRLRPPPWERVDAPVMAQPQPTIRMNVSRAVVYGDLAPASFRDLPLEVEAPEPRVSVADDVVLVPGHLFIDRRSGTVLPQSRDAVGDHDGINGLSARPPPLLRLPEQVAGEVFVLDCHYATAYGHILLEALPGLMLLDRVPAGIQIATSIPPSPSFDTLVRGLGIDPSRVRHYRDLLFCRRAYLPERLVRLRKSVHPLAQEAFSRLRRLGSAVEIDRPARIFVSRSHINRRRLVNEVQIEAIFERHGFHIIHPESLPIEQQIALFDGAEMIAGLGGSAMHSTVFTPPETKVLMISSLGWFVSTDVLISQRDGQLGYVFGEPAGDAADAGDRPWRVDPAVVEAAIAAHFGL